METFIEFCVKVAIATAMVESHVANEGYYPTGLEQQMFRCADEVFAYCIAHCPQFLPTVDLTGWPCDWVSNEFEDAMIA